MKRSQTKRVQAALAVYRWITFEYSNWRPSKNDRPTTSVERRAITLNERRWLRIAEELKAEGYYSKKTGAVDINVAELFELGESLRSAK